MADPHSTTRPHSTTPPPGTRCRIVATAIWLAALLGCSLGVLPEAWPVGSAAMFAFTADTATEYHLDGTSADGRAVPMPADAFGVTTYELGRHLAEVTRPGTGFAGRRVLADLAAWWNAHHPDRPVAAVTLRARIIEIRPGLPERRVTLMTWPGAP